MNRLGKEKLKRRIKKRIRERLSILSKSRQIQQKTVAGTTASDLKESIPLRNKRRNT